MDQLTNENKNSWVFQGYWIKDADIDYGKEDELYYSDHSNAFMKKEFYLNEVKQSNLYVAVLGYYLLYINGKRVGNYELNSDWTNYRKIVYFDKYEISSYLKIGKNIICFELGNGMYNPSPLTLLGKYNLRERLEEIGTPRLICDLVNHGEVIISSDESWSVTKGNCIFNNLYLGETIDNNKSGLLDCIKEETTPWSPVCIDMTKRNVSKSTIPKIKQLDSVAPKSLITCDKNHIIDFGEMISGYISIKANAKKNQVIKILYSEEIEEGVLKFDTSLVGGVGQKIGSVTIGGGPGAPEKAIQTDTIICKEGINEFTNKFTYHSFRYVQVEGITRNELLDISASYVHTDLKKISSIEVDNDFYKELYTVGIRTKLNNVHSVFEDCARERLGYGGDIVALATSNLLTFDVEEFYKKIILDFRLEQTENGGIPETAPFMGIQSSGTGDGEGPILWQLVYPYIVYKHYQYYGDREFVEREYSYLQKQMHYLLNYELEDLVNHCLGDHGSVLIAGNFRMSTPDKLFVGYCTVLLFLKLNINLANAIGEETSLYVERFREIKRLVIDKFINEDDTFADKTQTSFAFALYLELAEGEQLCKKFVDKIIDDDYVFNSGIFGMMLSYEMLSKYGYDSVIEKWILREEAPGYKDMLSDGNKALKELFAGEHLSLNHAMFSSYLQWYYQGLGGIKIEDDAIGFNKVTISPYFSPVIKRFHCSIHTKQGTLTSLWERNHDNIIWKVGVPTSLTDLKIHIPLDYTEIKRCQQEEYMVISLKKRNTAATLTRKESTESRKIE